MKTWIGYMHGINLGGWLSQCNHTEERYSTFITEEDIKQISSWGLDHIRVPIDYNLVEDEEGNYKENGFNYISKAISWAQKYNLNMILDLHKTYGYAFDSVENDFFENESHQERFYKLWEEFAKRFGKFEKMLSFELLNEITKKEYCDIWNEISHKCIKRIRKFAPKIKILVGGYYSNSIDALPDLYPPFDDNIVYNFHFYEPLIFTHQGAPWISTMNTSYRVSLDDSCEVLNKGSIENLTHDFVGHNFVDDSLPLNESYFENMIKSAVRISEERDVPIYCGEYGVINLATPHDTLKWYRMFSSVMNKYQIGRAAWTYKQMDFGIIDEHISEVKDQIIKLL